MEGGDMSEPIPSSSSGDLEALLAQALADSGGPLTDDELQWAESEFGFRLDAPAVDTNTVPDGDRADGR
jgi:hypothetical protein